KMAYRLAARHGGMKAGADNGQRGYQLTFGIAYIRDFAMSHWILGESFETSAAWGDALALCVNVKRRLTDEHAARKLPGAPFVTCRVTQLYPTGVCIYFYFAYYYKGVDRPSEVYAEMVRAGSTGFLGRVVFDEWLRRRPELGLARIYVLARPAAGVTAMDRTAQLLSATGHGASAAAGVEVVEGDIREPDCGIAPAAA